jgi:hypothetical protein
MRWWLPLIVFAFAACASRQGAPMPMAGENWEVSGLTLQEYPNDSSQQRWHYLLRLRDVSGKGLHLTQLTRSFPGIDTFRVLPQIATIDLHIEPNDVLEIPCWETLFRSMSGNSTNFDFQVKKSFSGRDGNGNAVTFAAELPFDTRMHAAPVRLLEFAKFIDHEISYVPPPHYCETVPNAIPVVQAKAQKIYFLIGATLVSGTRPLKLRTRWIGPNGDEVKVIESDLRPIGQTSGMALIMHATHSIPRELFQERPGEWKVELFLEGQSQGVYTIRVM